MKATMKKTIALVLMTAVWLSGCSGRDNDVEVVDPLEIAAAQAAVTGQIRVLSTSSTLLTGGSETTNIIAIVTDESNRAIEFQDVTFSSDGGVLQNIVSTTTDTGEATAQLNLAGILSNRNITVTAALGSLEASVQVALTGTVIEMTAPETIIIGDTPELEFQLLDGIGQAIPNQVIELRSDAGNTFSRNSVTTDANGLAAVAVSTTAGADTITASTIAGTVVNEFTLNVLESIQAVDIPVRVRVISNVTSIETGGTDIASITTLVTDENNRVISGRDVEFSATGGVLQNISSITNAAGQATAELSLAGDFRNQDITVTATVDAQEGSVLLTASGSSLSIAGPTALVSGDTAELELTLTGGNEQPISNEIVSIVSNVGNVLSNETVTTNADGKATLTVGSAAGDDVITVSALNGTVVKQHSINVAADILSVLNPEDHDSLSVDSPSLFQVLWESSGEPVTGRDLRFTITAGELRTVGGTSSGGSTVTATTNASGVASIEIESNAAGPATIAFSDALDADPLSQFDVEFVAVDVTNIAVEASPASVGTGNQSTISATVTDDFGNPVRDVVVEFSSPNLRGGSLSPVTAVTDTDGKAGITFNAGGIPTEINELVIQASASDVPGVTSTVNLTVTERQLNVIIGVAGTLTEADTDTRYRRAGLVQVTDGAGRPVPDASIIVSMIPTVYRFGALQGVDTDGDGEADAWARLPHTTYACESEDTNFNRVLDATSEDVNNNGLLDQGEDTNQNGRLDISEDVNGNGVLDPNDPGLVDSDPVNRPTIIGGEITTDANGVGFFSIAYPQSNADWFDVLISARVQALGVESVATFASGLDPIASDLSDIEVAPPNLVSPFGELDVQFTIENGLANVISVNPPVCNQPAGEMYIF